MPEDVKIEPCRALVNGKMCMTPACGDDWEGYDCPECGSDPAQGLVSWNTLQLDRRDAARWREYHAHYNHYDELWRREGGPEFLSRLDFAIGEG
jgi:hypothetical protein